MEPTFIIWMVIAISQVILFSFFLGKMSRDKTKDENSEETIDIIPVANYNDMTYWLEDRVLYREHRSSVTMNKSRAEVVDQLNSGLNPNEIIYIINLLEDSK